MKYTEKLWFKEERRRPSQAEGMSKEAPVNLIARAPALAAAAGPGKGSLRLWARDHKCRFGEDNVQVRTQDVFF